MTLWNRSNLTSVGLPLLLVFLLSATSGFEPLPFHEARALKRAQNLQPIEVLILESPLTQIRGQAGSVWGLDADRLYEFSRHTGLQLKTATYKNIEDLKSAYQKGKGQIVISREPLKLLGAQPGPLFEEIRKGLFCHKKITATQLEELASLRILKAKWPMKKEINRLLSQKADCFYSELKEGLFATQPYLQIQKVGEVSTPEHHTWWVRNKHEDLYVLLMSWYRKDSRSGDMSALEYRHNISLKTLRDSDIRRFYQRAATILPEYLPAFQEVAAEVRLPWTLAAAVAYQESQWNPFAVSYTGVRGFMQLTLQTASHMNVTDRDDPFESIWGGTRYLRHLWEEWREVQDPKDRILLTLASYNIGIGHMFDAMELAKQQGTNPYKWQNLEKILPQLENEKVYKRLTYGKARGRETVDFVTRTYSFFQLLSLRR